VWNKGGYDMGVVMLSKPRKEKAYLGFLSL
jgi:hypothetical protein